MRVCERFHTEQTGAELPVVGEQKDNVVEKKDNLSSRDKSGAFGHTPVLLHAKTTMVSLNDKGRLRPRRGRLTDLKRTFF